MPDYYFYPPTDICAGDAYILGEEAVSEYSSDGTGFAMMFWPSYILAGISLGVWLFF